MTLSRVRRARTFAVPWHELEASGHGLPLRTEYRLHCWRPPLSAERIARAKRVGSAWFTQLTRTEFPVEALEVE